MTHQVSESKLWQSLTAVASGIITNLLYDLVSPSSNIIQQAGTQYTQIADSPSVYGILFTICGIFLLFFFIWGMLILIILIGNKASKQLSFKKMEKISGFKLIVEYNKAKEQTIDLNNNIFGRSAKDTVDATYIKLHIRDLAKIITSLHARFCPHNLRQRAYMKHYFRKLEHTTILNINNTISKYEFVALIDLLYAMVSQASLHTHGDKLMLHDCKKMITMLNELKTIANSTE